MNWWRTLWPSADQSAAANKSAICVTCHHNSNVNPLNTHCCHMGTAIKHPVPLPDRVKPLFVIFDIWARLHVRVPGCQKLQMMAYPGLAQDALYLYRCGNSGRQRVNGTFNLSSWSAADLVAGQQFFSDDVQQGDRVWIIPPEHLANDRQKVPDSFRFAATQRSQYGLPLGGCRRCGVTQIVDITKQTS